MSSAVASSASAGLPPRHAEELVRATFDTEERIRLQARVLDCVRQAVIAIDTDGNINYWNGEAEKLYGWREAEVLGRPMVEVAAPVNLSAEASNDILRRLLGGESWSGEVEFRTRDGRVFPGEIVSSPIFDDGEVIGVVAVSQDITLRRRAQEELRMREAQLADAQEIAHVGSYVYAPEEENRWWSREGLRIFGADPDNLSPDTPVVTRALHPDDAERALAEFNRCVSDRQPFAMEYRIILPDGRERIIFSHGRIDDKEGSMRVLGTVQDVTEQRMNERELHRRARQQEAIATFSQLALGGSTLPDLYDAAAAAVAEHLDADLSDLFTSEAGQLRLVAGGGFGDGVVGNMTVTGNSEHSHAGYTLAQRQPVIVEDFEVETRFKLSELLKSHGVRSGVMVGVGATIDRQWGVLGAHYRTARHFTDTDVTFLRTIATILGQAIERANAEEQLRARAAQQSAIAELGRLVLSRAGDDIHQRACELVKEALGVDDATYIASGTAAPTDAISEMSVPVAGPMRRFGVLTARSMRRRDFGAADVHFLESIANILAEGIQHDEMLSALVASEERYRSVVEGATEIIFTLDPDGTILSLNPAFEAATGARMSDWIGRSFLPLFHPDDAPLSERTFANIVRTGKPHSLVARMVGLSGREVVFEFSSFPRIVDGRVEAVYGFGRDITAQHRAQHERDEVMRDLQLLLESTAEGIYTVDTNGRCTMINGAGARMLGRAREELIGIDMHQTFHHDRDDISPCTDADCAIDVAIQRGIVSPVNVDAFRRKDGTMMPVEYSAAPIVDRGVTKGAVVTFTDITERRKLETKLQQASRLSSLGKLAATVAHEFNNVLMGISPFVDILRRHPTGDRANTAVEQISRSVKRGKRITEDILRFTQPAEPVMAAVEVSPWLRTVSLEARSLLSAKYIVDVVVADPHLAITADANQLNQIFVNLIINARDAMPDGGMVVIRAQQADPGTRFDFGFLAHPERYVHFVVEDSGTGMDDETMRHIFEPLFTTKKNGTGLGLPVAHQVVRRHGGEIFAESTPGAGTKFHVFLPRADRVIAEATPEPTTFARARVRRILLVEDEKAVSAGLIALLGLEGVTVDLVESGAEVLDAICRTNPEAVILDVGLPDMDGTRVYAAIAELYPHLPVIFSTGHGDQSKLEEHLTKPNVGFLLKPYEVETLLETLDQVVE